MTSKCYVSPLRKSDMRTITFLGVIAVLLCAISTTAQHGDSISVKLAQDTKLSPISLSECGEMLKPAPLLALLVKVSQQLRRSDDGIGPYALTAIYTTPLSKADELRKQAAEIERNDADVLVFRRLIECMEKTK